MNEIKFFISFDENSQIIGRFRSDIHGDKIPDFAVEVDEELFNKTIVETDGEWKLGFDKKITKHSIMLSLDQVKTSKFWEISAAFTETVANGFMSSLNIKLDCSINAVQNLKSLYDFAVLMGDTKLAVVDKDGIEHQNIDLADIHKLLKEAITHYRALDETKQGLIAAINAATTPEAVAAVKWS